MKKLLCMSMLAFLITAFLSMDAGAWPDKKKKGFVLGFHGGYSSSTYEKNGEEFDGTGFHVGPYIGYGFNKHAILTFRVRYVQTSSNDSDAEYYTPIMGGDIMLFPKPKKLGLFLNAGLARALAASKAGGTAPWGTVVYGGVGYFFNKIIFCNVDYAVGSFEQDLSTGTISLSVGALWY